LNKTIGKEFVLSFEITSRRYRADNICLTHQINCIFKKFKFSYPVNLRVRYIISFFLFLLTGARLQAQVTRAKELFYHLGEKDGLSDNLVNCFFQDSRGLMWMGTQNGLNSFDGSEIRNWHTGTGGDDHLADNVVNAIGEDITHTVWIATNNGISSFDPNTHKIRSYHNTGDNFIYSLAVDGNRLWLGSGGGLLLFDLRTKIFTHFINNINKTNNLSRRDNYINYVYLDSKKRLWTATMNGLWLFNIKKQTFEQYDSPKNDPRFEGMFTTVYEDHNGKIWTGGWSNGLKQIIPEKHQVVNFYGIPSMPSHIMSIVEQLNNQKQYRLWLSDFLTELNVDKMQAEPHDLKPIAGATSLNPRCLYVSRDNLLWISTVKGVYILDQSRQLFKNYFVSQRTNISGQNPSILAGAENIWLGGDNNFALKMLDYDFNIVKDYTPAIHNLSKDLNNNGFAVTNIVQHNQKELYLATTGGVIRIDKKTNKLHMLCSSVGDSSRKTSFINNIYFSHDKIWCFPWRCGVWQYDTKMNKFISLVNRLPDGNVLKNLNLANAVEDRAGNVWIADMDYGLIKYTLATKKFERVINKYVPPFSRVLNIMLLNGKLWTVANSDVVEIDPVTNFSRVWSLPEGMNRYTHDYTSDNDGNIWMATRTGLIAFDTNNFGFSQYTEEDGLITNDMDGTLKKLPSGEMIYAGENYITSFTPANLLRTPARKELLLTEVSTGDTDLLRTYSSKVVVPPGMEHVKIKWAFVNYSNPMQNRYYSKIDKIDKDWNYAGNKGMVEYNGLTPGEYKFSYRAVTSDGLADAERTITIIVSPRFWQTWWFQGIVMLGLISAVVVIIQYVRLREKRKSAIQLQLSALEMKALRAQMNPHFIFNALNSIQECIITKDTNTAYSYLSSFSKLVRMILENSERQFITLDDEVETLKLYLSIEKLRFDDTFEYLIKTVPEVDISFIRLPAMIIQPFVENALWHGLIHKKGDKKLVISFRQENKNLICVIKDNGVGRGQAAQMKSDSTIKKHSMGVKITEERLQLLETEASIVIDDLNDEDGTPAGTKVTIIIPLEY
jgi:ligand-binding sensor domain-containing protein